MLTRRHEAQSPKSVPSFTSPLADTQHWHWRFLPNVLMLPLKTLMYHVLDQNHEARTDECEQPDLKKKKTHPNSWATGFSAIFRLSDLQPRHAPTQIYRKAFNHAIVFTHVHEWSYILFRDKPALDLFVLHRVLGRFCFFQNIWKEISTVITSPCQAYVALSWSLKLKRNTFSMIQAMTYKTEMFNSVSGGKMYKSDWWVSPRRLAFTFSLLQEVGRCDLSKQEMD